MSKFVEIKNPYTLQFSYIPPQFIERTLITNEIINNFIRDIPTYRGMFKARLQHYLIGVEFYSPGRCT